MQRIVALNVVFISLQPLLLLGLLFATGSFELLPKWGYGIVLSWAFYLPLWSLFGVTSTEKPPRLRQVGFIATSFVLPLVMAVVMGESLVMVALDFSTFHTLGIGLAFGMALIFGPLVEVQIQEMRLTHIRLRGEGDSRSGQSNTDHSSDQRDSVCGSNVATDSGRGSVLSKFGACHMVLDSTVCLARSGSACAVWAPSTEDHLWSPSLHIEEMVRALRCTRST